MLIKRHYTICVTVFLVSTLNTLSLKLKPNIDAYNYYVLQKEKNNINRNDVDYYNSIMKL